ncbi:MAG: hypothetical protein H0V29_03025 [Thermoleophilaceae bacterium]|nr:hypothetical protein [Thermoleophilaceae bacterium]
MLEELIDALLYEGYALYPYTPGSTKNSTPTPFGIVYPPGYAADQPAAHDTLRMDMALEPAAEGAEIEATVRFLQAGTDSERRAIERRVELPRTSLDALRDGGVGAPFEFDGLTGRARVRVHEIDGDRSRVRVRVCVHNTTEPERAIEDRGSALAHSLISTHVIAHAPGSRFESATEHPELQSVNTFPVLATEADDTALGATIVLPDHPRLAPESAGSLFDGTEIEEALLLHVQTLSDPEREAIASGDPAVRAMVERAACATPEEMMRLHGRLEMRDPEIKES